VNEPSVTIRFDGNGRAYYPGETLSGDYTLDGIDPAEVRSIELSVLWYTEGKGDENLAVHDFRRVSLDEGESLEPGWPNRFQTTLPNSPLSYDGVIVKVRWCVRVRVFLTRGREVVGQQRFRLGNLPAAKALKPLRPSPSTATCAAPAHPPSEEV
jgi:hypothetical protein